MFGDMDVNKPKEHPPRVWQRPPETLCVVYCNLNLVILFLLCTSRYEGMIYKGL
jgi:hypothetical protein